jgi:uncharacterized protein YndB with AHSA1/START domain
MAKVKFVCVTYIATSPVKLWNALIDPKITCRYWQHKNVSGWKAGSPWEHRSCDAKGTLRLVGKVVEFSPSRRLVLTWAFPRDKARPEKHSRVALEISRHRGITRLTVTHDRLEAGSEMWKGIAEGWPIVLSSLKTLLETGRPLPVLW